MPPVSVHFNGGVNLPDTDTVLRTLSEAVPYGLRRLPDGETGARAQWIGFQNNCLGATHGLEPVVNEPVGGYAAASTTFRLFPGSDPDLIEWAEPGYAGEYTASFATFDSLRSQGIVPPSVRFQVEYPTPLAVGNLFHPADRNALTRSYETALLADLDRLLAAIPHRDLAVQWDAAVETVTVDLSPDELDEHVSRLGRLAEHVPDDVNLGFHLCYGDAGHVHMVEPTSLDTQVRLANAIGERSDRAVTWLSFTVPQDRADEAYFRPLEDLRTDPETELYFALVPYHPDSQAEGTTHAQVGWLERYLPASVGLWGICTECGMARVDRDDIPRLLDLHRTMLAEYGGTPQP